MMRDDLAIALIVVLCVFVVIIPFLTTMPVYDGTTEELYFREHDFLIYANQQLCLKYIGNGSIAVNSMSAAGSCIAVPSGTLNVSVTAGNRRIWFLAEKRDREAPERTETRISLAVPSEAPSYALVPVNITVRNGLPKGRVFIITVTVDGTLVKEMPLRLLAGEQATITEPMRFMPGSHTIIATLDTGERSTTPLLVHQRFGSAALVVLLVLPWAFWFRKRNNAPLHVLAFSAACLVLLPSFAGLIADFSAIALALAVLTLAGYWYGK